MKRGIELEYWVIDEEGRLTSPGDVAARFDYVDREANRSLIELKTRPRSSLDGLRRNVRERLRELLDALESDGKRLAPLGTPLSRVESDVRSTPRIDVQRAVLGDAFDHVAACAGTHVHFEQTDPVTQLNALTALDPALCLVNASPYYDGRRAGTCARPFVYRRLGYAEFPALGRLWRYADTAAEWRRRVRRRYLDFRDAALDAGVDGGRFARAFDPETTVWNPVRLRDDIGTVEWRAPDATLPSHVLQFVEDVTRLLEEAIDGAFLLGASTPRAGTGRVEVPAFDRVRTLSFDAMTHGLDSPTVRQYLSALGFETSIYRPIGRRLGDGIDVGFRADGAETLLTDEHARELRREYADLLERDLERLGSTRTRSRESAAGGRNAESDRPTATWA